MLGKRRLVANLQHLRITRRPPGFEHEGSGAGGAAYQRGDAEPINRVGQVVAVRVLAQHTRPGRADPEAREADSDIEVRTTGKSGEMARGPQIVFHAAVADEGLAKRQHPRWWVHDGTVAATTARTAR